MKAGYEVVRIEIIFIFLLFMAAPGLPAQDKALVKVHNDPSLEWGGCPDFMPQGCEIAVLHGDPAEKNVDIFFKVPANSKIPKHYHTSVERMVLVAGELEVTYEGEEPQTLKVGSYAFGPAGKPHSAKCGNSPCVLFIAFEEPLDAIPVAIKN
ncbi:DUF4437 domain-containing protein [Gillisia limnaea]|uniref:Cupin 2 conserved barrel domain protein n=1 Tax=Gillisia limnaea (strain DSM 15749 / LMG 21470 / R-8282) TaxID=865937 RepID=H2BYN4_GILLR|nr:DUF4437 domain-containing protein [Gillisia limnaea]EHQ01155.1 Cupin 2 conserved barrel domain protein [Gillisia limnaea DSM 15749]